MSNILENSKNYKSVEEFLNDNGVEEMPKTTKELYKTIKKILSKLKEQEDYTDLVYSKNKGNYTIDDYFQQLKDIDDRYNEGRKYKSMTLILLKRERKERIKSIFNLK